MTFDQLLKKNFWAVLAVPVAFAAFLNAEAIAQLVGASLSLDADQLVVAHRAPPASIQVSPPPFHTTSADPILSRNPFDSVTGPLTAKALELSNAVEETDAGVVDGNPFDAPPCEGVQVLAIAASDDPAWSFVAMRAPNEHDPLLRRRGGAVGPKTVKFVGADRVWLAQGPELCQAEMYSKQDAGAPPAAPRAPAAPTPAAPGTLDPAIARGIQKVSDTEFNIDRGVVDKILENQADLMRQARIVPEQENGRMVGIRLFGVRPNTLLAVLGMENGDRLQTINGFDMTSPEKALEAYARLRTADHLTVQVNRKGANTNIDYNIR